MNVSTESPRPLFAHLALSGVPWRGSGRPAWSVLSKGKQFVAPGVPLGTYEVPGRAGDGLLMALISFLILATRIASRWRGDEFGL